MKNEDKKIRQEYQEMYGEPFPTMMPTDEDTLLRAESNYDYLMRTQRCCNSTKYECEGESCTARDFNSCDRANEIEHKNHCVWTTAVCMAAGQ